MLRFFVIIDFIDYQFLSIINANRSVGERIQISNVCAYCKMRICTCWNVLTCDQAILFRSDLSFLPDESNESIQKRIAWSQVRNVWDTESFLTPIDNNRWVSTTFVWLSIGHWLADANRCQLTSKASIVIHWSINFPIIGFIDCSSSD